MAHPFFKKILGVLGSDLSLKNFKQTPVTNKKAPFGSSLLSFGIQYSSTAVEEGINADILTPDSENQNNCRK